MFLFNLDKKSKTFHPGKYKWPKGQPGYVTREDLDPMFKIAMNFSANVAIYGILKGMLDEIETTQSITSAALLVCKLSDKNTKKAKVYIKGRFMLCFPLCATNNHY